VERFTPETHTCVARTAVFALRPLSLVSIALFISTLKFIRIRGAEGTVIEGEDLTHMIWGLDSNSPQLVHSQHQSSRQVCKSLPQSTSSSRVLKETPFALHHNHIIQNLYSRDVIDISIPELQTTSTRVSDIQFARPARTYVEDRHLFRKDQTNDIQSKKANKNELTRRDSPIQLYPYSFRSLPETQSYNAGLGIDLWHGNLRSGTLGPTFVSRDARDSPLIVRRPPGTIYPTQIYQTSRGLPARDTHTFEYIGSHQGMPTPPDTSSPQWSPCFRHNHVASVSPELNHPVNISQYPVHYSTRDTLISSRQVQTQALLRKPGNCSATPDSLEVMHRLPPYPYSDNIGVDYFSSSGHNGDVQSPKHRLSQDKFNLTPPSPVSPETRRGLVQHQPRSIPLARLIQRRLSSVVEEEIVDNNSCEKHPTSSPTSTKGGSGCPNLDDNDTHKENRNKAQLSSRKAVNLAGPSDDHAKRAYKATKRPSRHASTGAQDASIKPQRIPPKVDQPATSANRSGNKENGTSAHSKSKKKRSRKQNLVFPTAKN